ncbi:hypothetical protein [Anaeromassilibacillus senegalensis]|uniref:hypothetical protein n=1 Tax=Anaeromassilibacillus senegalensis TaxID=1673717 RepID=UPI0006801E9E|nr:hypothetical protein [Anaeromassilibacillus senegalensis]
MKHHKKVCKELGLINHNLNMLIQNQNEIYVKLEELRCAVDALQPASDVVVSTASINSMLSEEYED